MRIEHIAIWTENIELLHAFYQKYFDAVCGNKYTNPVKQFTSYFLSFGEGSARIELMHTPTIGTLPDAKYIGLAHFAVSVGSRDKVDELTNRLRADGYTLLSEPRTTGDGYYESAVADPEGNLCGNNGIVEAKKGYTNSPLIR